MSSLSLIVHMSIPLYPNKSFPYDRAKRIAEEATLMDKYFDYGLMHRIYNQRSKNIYQPMLEGFSSASSELQRSGSNFKFALCISGLLIEQMLKDDMNTVNQISSLVNAGTVELLAAPFYNSPASVYHDSKEFQEQVKEHMELVKRVFSTEPTVLANSKLIYNDRVAKVAESLGIKGVVVDYVPSLNAITPNKIYQANNTSDVKLLIRDVKSSLQMIRGELNMLDLLDDSYHLLYVEANSLPKANPLAYRNLALSFSHAGIETVFPSEILEQSIPSGSLAVPEQLYTASYDIDGDFSTLLRNPMQRLFHDRLCSLLPYIEEVNDQRIKGIWRLMQQVDFLLEMDERKFEEVDSIFSSPYEAFSVLNTILVDFEGKVATLVQRIRKAKKQAEQKLIEAQKLALKQQAATSAQSRQ